MAADDSHGVGLGSVACLKRPPVVFIEHAGADSGRYGYDLEKMLYTDCLVVSENNPVFGYRDRSAGLIAGDVFNTD